MNRDRFNTVKLTAEYAATFGAYWMIYAITGGFASVFMLAKGYTNTHIGMTLAAANIMALAMQPFVADRMDRVKGIRIIDAAVWMTLMMMITGAGYFIFGGGTLMLATVIAVILAIHALIQPILNSLAFRLSESGTKVSFGVARAGGSLGFSAILAVLGTLVEIYGAMVLPVCTEAACLLLISLLVITKISFVRLKRSSDADQSGAAEAEEEGSRKAGDERIDLRAFIRRNKFFFIMNLGIAGLLFSNATMTNFMAQIGSNVGGTTEEVGRILSLMAFFEIPTMVFFGRIKKRFRSSTLIKLASFGFTAKIAVCWMADSVGMLFASQAFQLVAFALMMPAMVYYVDEIMSPGEAVKGQALFTMMMTLSTIFSSLAGGWIIDAFGVDALNLISLLITAAGNVVVILSINRVKSHR